MPLFGLAASPRLDCNANAPLVFRELRPGLIKRGRDLVPAFIGNLRARLEAGDGGITNARQLRQVDSGKVQARSGHAALRGIHSDRDTRRQTIAQV